ncbi:baseplate J/gp47 family protein [Escherichia coli]
MSSCPPFGGNQFDYVRWSALMSAALPVPGVFRTWKGGGTVGVTFVMDNRSNIFPQPADVERVAGLYRRSHWPDHRSDCPDSLTV